MSEDESRRAANEEADVEGHRHRLQANEEPTDESRREDDEGDDVEAHTHKVQSHRKV